MKACENDEDILVFEEAMDNRTLMNADQLSPLPLKVHQTGSLTVMQTHRGFPTEILRTQLDPKYLCSSCSLVLRKPVQSFCGHRFCKLCIEDYVRKNGKTICAWCEKEGTQTEPGNVLDQTFVDKAIARELDSLIVYCSYAGCDWSGSLDTYEEHEGGCPHQPRSEVWSADQRSKEAIKAALTELLHTFESRLTIVDNLAQNLSTDQRQLGETVQELQRQLQEMGLILDQNNERNAETCVGGDEIGQAMKELRERSDDFEQISAVLTKQVEKYMTVLEVVMRHTNKGDGSLTEGNGVITSLETKLRAVERTVMVKDTAIADMNLKLKFLEMTSYDGKLLWKIANFKKCMENAKSGKTTSFYSHCFYTSRQGYRMCARLYPYGDGMGKGSHISLFLVLMRGTYDDLLPWPFCQKVTFMLLDQKRREHIIDAFHPDPASSSFKKPVSEMNIACGCPLFVAISQLQTNWHQYVKDDTMFIHVIIDTTDLN